MLSFIPCFLLSLLLAILFFVAAFQWLSRAKPMIRTKPMVVTVLMATASVMCSLAYIDAQGVKNKTAPLGIVSYEFAWTPEQANLIVRSWDPADKIMVALSIGLDYLFMPLYATSLATILLAMNENNMVLAALQYSAWAFDAVETGMLALILTAKDESSYPDFAPKLAAWCATRHLLAQPVRHRGLRGAGQRRHGLSHGCVADTAHAGDRCRRTEVGNTHSPDCGAPRLRSPAHPVAAGEGTK